MTNQESEPFDPAKPITNEAELADLINSVYAVAVHNVLRRLRVNGLINAHQYAILLEELPVWSIHCYYCGLSTKQPRVSCQECRGLFSQLLAEK